MTAAKVNWEKSSLLLLSLGKWELGLPIIPGGLSWEMGGINYLGVFLGVATSQMKNWDGLV